MNKKIIIAVFLIVFTLLISIGLFNSRETLGANTNPRFWNFQAIDTMKYSRDTALEKLDDISFDKVIDKQVKGIAETGATHVAIATPYDAKFLPILKRWVKAARKYNLNVWFRGNFSGWEEWFGFSPIDREEHKKLTKEFILNNPELFSDGDMFSACPECENGGPGDPRQNGDVEGFRKFMIDEYQIARNAFESIGKKVEPNLASMNGDVANLVMDRETTKEMGGKVVIDHYVDPIERLAIDAKKLARQSGGEIILGEFGAPIPDINGEMTEDEQGKWVENVMDLMLTTPEIVGMSYWTSHGGSTRLWNEDGTPRKAVSTLRSYYKPSAVKIAVQNEYGRPAVNAIVSGPRTIEQTSSNGYVVIPAIKHERIQVQKVGYKPLEVTIDPKVKETVVNLERIQEPNIIQKLLGRLGIDI